MADKPKNILQMPARTFTAKLIEVTWETTGFRLAGTLDGFIDLATPGGTYPLSLQEAESLVAALEEVINDVRRNCLYELDSLQGEKNG